MGQRLSNINIKYFKMIINQDQIGYETQMDINCRCPICGDSRRNKRKRRFHLYTKTTYKEGDDRLKCFRCDWSGNMYQFIKEMNPSLLRNYLDEIRGNSFNNIIKKKKESEKKEEDISSALLSTKINLSIESSSSKGELADPIQNNKSATEIEADKIHLKVFSVPKEFKKLKNSDKKFVDYINKRLPKTTVDINEVFLTCDEIIVINNKKINLKNCIVVPLYFKDMLYGFQARDITVKRFYTYIPDENSGMKAFNWFNLNKSEPVYIAESVFDACSMGFDLNHVTAALGSDFSKNLLDELQDPIFCFDNQNSDKASLKKSNKLINKYKVFVWPPLKSKDFNELLLLGANPEDIKKLIESNIKKNSESFLIPFLNNKFKNI